MMAMAFDSVLLAIVLWLAWRTVTDADLFRATIHFVALGLLIAVGWVRLSAPDVALAEAAVGAGLTGALTLSALAALGRGSDAQRAEQVAPRSATPVAARRAPVALGKVVAASLAGALFLALAGALLSIPQSSGGLATPALAALDRSGVSNPVTAALLNYRAYDTLLELAVLFVAVVAVWSVRAVPLAILAASTQRPMVAALMRSVVPGLIMASGYLLWRGAYAPGGAFQGGALLAGAGVLLVTSGLLGTSVRVIAPLRVALAVGLATFLCAAVAVGVIEGRLLEYPPAAAKHWILAIESAAVVSIALTLVALYVGGRPVAPEHADASEAGECNG